MCYIQQMKSNKQLHAEVDKEYGGWVDRLMDKDQPENFYLRAGIMNAWGEEKRFIDSAGYRVPIKLNVKVPERTSETGK